MGLSVSEIVKWTNGRIVNPEQVEKIISSVCIDRPAPLAASRSNEVAFFFARGYQHELATAKPGVLITGEPFVKPLQAAALPLWSSSVVIACPDPYLALAVLSEKLAVLNSSVAHVSCGQDSDAAPSIHPSAVVHPTAVIDSAVVIGPNCVIQERAQIGAGTVLYAGCFIGPSVKIGKNSVLFPRVSVYEWTILGDRVRLHAGVVLGSDGFGYAPKIIDGQVRGHQKIFHLGRVVVGDDVEIGANSCVDRGTMGDTVIANNVKLDNLVHVGHNSQLDEGAVICGGTCLAGRASVGRYAYVGGLTGITNAVRVGDGAKVGALSLVTKDVPPGGTAVGNPQREHREHFKVHALLNKLSLENKHAKGG